LELFDCRRSCRRRRRGGGERLFRRVIFRLEFLNVGCLLIEFVLQSRDFGLVGVRFGFGLVGASWPPARRLRA